MHTSVQLLPVNFMVYNLLKFGKNKGKVDPRSVHYVTLMRDPTTESVGDTIDRLKDMYSIYTVDNKGNKHYESRMTSKYKILTAKETEEERNSRYERLGLEVVEDGTAAVASSAVDPVRVTTNGDTPIITAAGGPKMVVPAYDEVIEKALAKEGL